MFLLEFEKSKKFTALRKKVKTALDADQEYIQTQAKISEIENKLIEINKEIENKIAELNKEKTRLLDNKYCLNDEILNIEKRVIFDTIDDPKDAEIVAHFY